MVYVYEIIYPCHIRTVGLAVSKKKYPSGHNRRDLQLPASNCYKALNIVCKNQMKQHETVPLEIPLWKAYLHIGWPRFQAMDVN